MRLLNVKQYALIFLMLAFIPGQAFGQRTRISGIVTDASTGHGIPFANVTFLGTTIGSTSDVNGYYFIATNRPGDSLTVTYMGFVGQTQAVTSGIEQKIDFQLEEDQITLKEFIVVPEEELVDLFFTWILNHKDSNDIKKLDYYEYASYNKIRIDINNVNKEKLEQKKIMKSFDFVLDHVDTSELNGKAYMPALLSESISKVYYRKSPRATKEVIQAYKITGTENESVSRFLGGQYQNVNVYDNRLFLFEKNFISPISKSGMLYYEYELTDTILIDDKWCYELAFKPRRRQELTFSGSVWVHDTTYAIKRVDMKIADDANLNFVNDVWIKQEYELIENRHWMVVQETIIADVNLVENTIETFGFFTRRSTMRKDFVFNQPKHTGFYSAVDVSVENEALMKSASFWDTARYKPLTTEESGVEQMIDSVKKVPAYKNYSKLVYMITRGYWKQGKFEIGPVYKMLSFNSIEGTRIRFGGRTGTPFSTSLQLEAYTAYGFKDKAIKFGTGVTYMISRNPRRMVHAGFKYDLEQLGQNPNAFSTDNFFAAIFRRNPAYKLTMVREYSLLYEHEWFNGLSNSVRFLGREIFPLGDTRFIIYEEDGTEIIKESINTSEIQFLTRFSLDEKFLYGDFNRISLGTRYPVLEVLYGYGIPGFLGGEYEYHRLQLRLQHYFNIGSIGWSKYVLESGKIWGTLPYALLTVHPSNESFIFYESAFNLMNYYEFISDQYISIYYTHHFDGLLFDKVPLVRKLKWRTVVHGRAVSGSLTDANKSYSHFPVFSGEVIKPYGEAGVGIENIFKFIRIDGIWRFSYLDHPNVSRFRIFVSMKFSL